MFKDEEQRGERRIVIALSFYDGNKIWQRRGRDSTTMISQTASDLCVQCRLYPGFITVLPALLLLPCSMCEGNNEISFPFVPDSRRAWQ